VTGKIGAMGSRGPQGLGGANGLQGAQGTQGVIGPVGPNGAVINVNKATSATTTTMYLVGRNSYNTATMNTDTWYVNQHVYAQNGRVYSANGFYQNSDESLKNIVGEVDFSIDVIKSIPKFYYYWKDKSMGEDRKIGTSAQILSKYFPELVSEGIDGKLTVDYSGLSIVLMKAFEVLYSDTQELKARIEELEKHIMG
jgi:hypothetical protein